MIPMRFLLDRAGAPAWNMAVDELLQRTGLLRESGFLRFYQWNPFSLSLGYAQRPYAILDRERARENGIGVVRRATGGRMVFHAREWTFSAGLPPLYWREAGLQGATFLDRFKKIVTPLVEGLAGLGLPARFGQEGVLGSGHGGGRIHCYAASAGHSVFLGEKKLIGAAGVDHHGFLMIHGSVPIHPEPFPAGVLAAGREPPRDLPVACLGDFLPPSVISRLPEILAESCEASWGLPLPPSTLSGEEQRASELLVSRKYEDPDWPDHRDGQLKDMLDEILDRGGSSESSR